MKQLLSFLFLTSFCLAAIAGQYNCSKKNHHQHTAKQAQKAPVYHYLDVLHYNLNIDFTEKQQSKISGNTEISATVKSSRNEISLDLLGMQVDSVLFNGSSKNFTRASDSIIIQLGTTVSNSDTFLLNVYYQGSPQKDPSGWGGFYFNGNYAFNLGVGFQVNPHNFGRAWFPCVDNFTDRATYEFHITTDTLSKAICNGLLINSTNNGDGTAEWHWELSQNIPTYLASVAVADYEFVEYNHTGLLEEIPVLLGARRADTNNLNQSFIHLPDAIDAFEQFLGPYRWDRVGFVLVPFSSGAMEHATNIAYPRNAANGTLNSETLMTHEFAHHWWGDLLTCETAEDMWINEGWASYMPILFDEYQYGEDRYRSSFRTNHREVLQWAHIRDDGYRAISGVPHEYTYGDHVYNKGANVAHTLRAYLKEDFFPCLNQLMEAYAFKNLNSNQFRDFLSDCSGKDMSDFFDNWVFNPGFTHISLDSINVLYSLPEDGNTYSLKVALRQKTKAAPALFENIPVEILVGNANESEIFEVNMIGSCGSYSADLAFEPSYVIVDPYQKIADATTDYLLSLDSVANYDLADALALLKVNTLGNSSNQVQVTKHWVAPDNWTSAPNNLHQSVEGYWSVNGMLDPDLEASIEFVYDGSTSGLNAHIDKELMSNSEDSLVLLYRENAAQEWNIADSFNLITGNTSDKRGRVSIPQIQLGEYCLAMFDASKSDTTAQFFTTACQTLTTIDELVKPAEKKRDFKVFPNPNKGKFQIDLSEFDNEEIEKISIYDLSGRVIWQKLNPENIEEVSTNKLNSAYYMVNIHLKDQTLSKKIFVQ